MTNHAKPVAPVVPLSVTKCKADVRQVIEQLKAFSKGNALGGDITVHDLIEDGRRF